MPDPIPMLDCRSAMQQLWDYVDGELTDDRLAAVQRHLDACSHCHPHVEFAKRFLAALHSTREDRPCPQAVRSRVMQSLTDAGLTLS